MLIFSLCLPAFLITFFLVFFQISGIHVFFGDQQGVLSVLSGIVQGLSAVVAIVFSVVTLAIQLTIGKYVSKAAKYLIFSPSNLMILSLFVYTIICSLLAMWIMWIALVDTVILMSILCIFLLVPFFLRVPGFLNPLTILKNLRIEILDSCDRKDDKEIKRKVEFLFHIITNSYITGELESSLEGIETIELLVEREGFVYPIDQGGLENREPQFLDFVQLSLRRLCLYLLETDSGLVPRLLETYGVIVRKVLSSPYADLLNLGNKLSVSLWEVCNASIPRGMDRESYNMDVARNIALKSYDLTCDIYEGIAIKEHPVAYEVLERLQKVVVSCGRIDVPIGIILPRSNSTAIRLLGEHKQTQAESFLDAILNSVIISYQQYKYNVQSIKYYVTQLALESKEDAFDEFASKCLEWLKKQYKKIPIEIHHVEGSGYFSFAWEGEVLHGKVENEKKYNILLWIRKELG